MNYQEIAEKVIDGVGGTNNVNSLTHCATRLRFNLKDDSKANKKILEETPGVMGVTIGGGQYQVIIGSEVRHVYNEINKHLTPGTNSANEEEIEGQKKNIGTRFLETISSIFTPILPAITAAGMIKAVLALVVAFKWVDNTSQTYQIINFMADAGFYFLPIMLANSAAKKFNCNPYLAMMVGGILLHPNFVTMVNTAKESGEAIKLGFLPIYNATYGSSVVPIILAVWFMSYMEKFADKYSPKMIKFFTVPLIAILVTGIVSLVVLGPIGFHIGNGIAAGILFLDTHVGWLVPMIIGAFFPLLVLTGTHYGIIPIGANNIMSVGYDAMIGPGNLASNIAQGGAALAVGLKSKDPVVKELGISSGITGVCGITEPALFGINMRFKTPLYAAMIGGGVGGLFIGFMGVKRFASGSPGLMTLPVYIGEDGFSNLIYACIGAAIAFGVAFVVSYILYKEKPAETAELDALEPTVDNAKDAEMISFFSPVDGQEMALSQVNDAAFASEAMGKGIAIIPSNGTFVSPINGTVEMVFETKHAIGLRSDEGLEVLIHIGLDTVKLAGKPFETFVKNGDRVQVGTPLVQADLNVIKAEGLETTTPIIFTNYTEFSKLNILNKTQVTSGNLLVEVGK
jgi:PTS system beta-glucosides-specific IIC component